jgi:hypothetical protein
MQSGVIKTNAEKGHDTRDTLALRKDTIFSQSSEKSQPNESNRDPLSSIQYSTAQIIDLHPKVNEQLLLLRRRP